MDYTEGSEDLKRQRAKKMMLWFGIVSLSMSFLGFTSAYIVSSKREDWLDDFQIPQAFYISLAVIIASSITMHLAKRNIKKENNGTGMLFLWTTLVLGVVFVWLQLQGFDEIIGIFGYNPTGPTSNITYTYIFLIATVHIAHIVVALIALLVVIYNHYKQKYTKGKTLGVELAATFWHFVDILWIYLFFFFYIVR
ncbi:MAG: cytochrome c oxidase subunit 3 [Bacteroidia bacterium]|nr:cytochrome c oxidase subunit 3 [Bacteroidia bacterium]NNF30557.1 heme-copper oxidase subunit III [Flavobacteriaceae bacterium]MBT8277109.1 cytochrome c oxidase subunit 3 [Bacteroidia bacterium]NNJ83125.1 heme-copper oxidase subunit III [Flavobacteriaceae bacterium]NNK53122.1 heme-copper oxidase subunit III [Flavobacteriaceae bacterium]